MRYFEEHAIVGERVTDHPRHMMKNEVKYRKASVKQESTKGQEEHLYPNTVHTEATSEGERTTEDILNLTKCQLQIK